MIYNHLHLNTVANKVNSSPDDAYELVTTSGIYFKAEHLFQQFNMPAASCRLNKRLVSLIWYSAHFFDVEIRRFFIITSLLRTQEKQDNIYADNEAYQKKPWKSVHQFGRGCDVRIRHLQVAYIKRFVVHINKNFPYDSTHPTALLERDHVHLQVREV